MSMGLTFRTLAALLLAAAPLSGGKAQTPPAQVAAPTAAPVKTIFLIREPDGSINAVRTVAFQKQGAILVLTTERGSRAVVEPRSVAAVAAWYTDEELRTSVNLPVLIVKYETLALRFPPARKFLNDEIAKFRAIIKAKDEEARAKKEADEARVSAVTSTHYDPAAGYTAEQIQELLRQADETKTAVPAGVDRIDQWAKPFQEHLEKLNAGSRYLNGEWITPEEVARREKVEREAAFLKSIDYEIDNVALAAADVHKIVFQAVTAAAVAMCAGLGLALFMRRRPGWRMGGIGLIVGAPLILASLFFLATREPSAVPHEGGPLNTETVVAALAEAAEIDPGQAVKEHTIRDAAINAFLTRSVSLRRTAITDEWTATREALAVRLMPGRIAVYELVRCAGLDWVVRYNLSYQSGSAGNLAVSGVKIGALECPPGLGSRLWKNLESQLVTLLAASKLTARFTAQPPGDHTITLSPAAPPAPAPSPAPAVEAETPTQTPGEPAQTAAASPGSAEPSATSPNTPDQTGLPSPTPSPTVVP
jgi:hypothetical protein